MKKYFLLKDGVVELTMLRDGQLILGQLLKGQTTRKELKSVLSEANYSYGVLSQNLKLIAGGYKKQIPLAVAVKEHESAKAYIHFDNRITDGRILNWLISDKFQELDFSFPVKSQSRLLTITAYPQAILRFPDGTKKSLKSLKKMKQESIIKLCGKNTKPLKNTNTIVADISGSMHCSVYGVAAVYPIKRLQRISKFHKRITFEAALKVEYDIEPEATIDTPSNLFVRGTIKSAMINVDGNIQCQNGIYNNLDLKTAYLRAGQAVYSSILQQYRLWAGSYVIASKMIDHCHIECLNTVITPILSASEVRVGNKLYVKDILNKSIIYLGIDFVSNEEFVERKNYHSQSLNKLNDIENSLLTEQLEMNVVKRKVIMQAKTLLKRQSNDSAKFYSILNTMISRFYGRIQGCLERFEQKLTEYEDAVKEFEKEQMELSFFDKQINLDVNPEIIVVGKIEPGVTIIAPEQTYKVRETLKEVSIKLDKLKGEINIQSLDLKG